MTTTFIVFLACWTFGAVFFPAASLASVKAKDGGKAEYFEENKHTEKISGSETVFLDDFNRRELFSLEGDYSEKQIVEYEGDTYLIYFDRAENGTVYMCVKSALLIQ